MEMPRASHNDWKQRRLFSNVCHLVALAACCWFVILVGVSNLAWESGRSFGIILSNAQLFIIIQDKSRGPHANNSPYIMRNGIHLSRSLDELFTGSRKGWTLFHKWFAWESANANAIMIGPSAVPGNSNRPEQITVAYISIVRIGVFGPSCLIGLVATYLILHRMVSRNRHRNCPRHCATCGYNLCGSRCAECPECGSPVVRGGRQGSASKSL